MEILTEEVTVKHNEKYYKRFYWNNTKNINWFTDQGDFVNEEKVLELNKAYSEFLKLQKIDE